MPHCVLTLKLIGELASGSLYSPLLRFLIVLDGPIMLDLSVIITISHCKPLTSSDKLLMRPLLGLRCWNDDDIISHPNSCTFWLQVCHLITMMAGRIWWVSGWHVCIVIHLLCFSIYKSHLWLRSPTHAVCKVNTLKLDKKKKTLGRKLTLYHFHLKTLPRHQGIRSSYCQMVAICLNKCWFLNI